MPPLIRQQPLLERIKAKLNPWDFLLWLSEEFNGSDWEEFDKTWTTIIGVFANLVFMVARANSTPSSSRNDDIFSDYRRRHGTGWLASICSLVVLILTSISILNAFFTFYRKRHYRLFEASLDATPSTPSAQRVRVDSSPLASSPMRFLSNLIASTSDSAASRAYPDAARDVWELAVWDPIPLCLSLFCLFSPGHVLVYLLFLPTAALDPRPSVTVATTIILIILLSVQLSFLRSNYSQQTKDTALIQKEVLNEYDTKFVHPSLNRPIRNVGTQTLATSTSPAGVHTREVDVYTPTTVINRGFKTNPNTNYAAQYDPDGQLSRPNGQPVARDIFQHRSSQRPTPRTSLGGSTLGTTPGIKSPPTQMSLSNGYPTDFSSPIKPRHEQRPTSSQMRYRDRGAGDGGSLGVYAHSNSPIRKAASTNHLREDDEGGFKDPRRPGSPLKRVSLPGGGLQGAGGLSGYRHSGTVDRESRPY
ncbi:MAG: hypothetical protein M1820_009807 [Bogoriella megaspora]|nr:MAG: hypothetical protein M1820_009807 [Bogoriella megaspora]